MAAEEKIRRAYHAEKPSGFEHQRSKNTERGEHCHQRGEEQPRHDRPFDLGPRGEIGPQPQEGDGPGGETDQQGRDNADGAVEIQRRAQGHGELAGDRIEYGCARRCGLSARFGKDGVALETESWQLRRRRRFQGLALGQTRHDRCPDCGEQQGGQDNGKRDEPAMKRWQRMQSAFAIAPESQRPCPCRQPPDQTQSEDQQDRDDR